MTVWRKAVGLFVRSSHVNWALLDQAMVSGVNFLTGILLVYFLGAEAFGEFTLLWMSVLFLNTLQSALIIFPMMSIGPKNPSDEEAAYYGAVIVQQFLFTTLGFILAGAVCFGLDWLFPAWELKAVMLPLCVVMVAFQLQEFLRRYFFTIHRANAAFLNDAISYLGQLTVLLALFFTVGLDVPKTLWAIAATSGLAVAVGLALIGRVSIEEIHLRQVMTRHWDFAKWLFASTLMQWLSGNFFIITAGAVLGPTSVGILKAAQIVQAVLLERLLFSCKLFCSCTFCQQTHYF